ncbi:hypothetical protein Hdeb2414_s0003g00108781 [Helianthus debilis subsp. tardiflorus]
MSSKGRRQSSIPDCVENAVWLNRDDQSVYWSQNFLGFYYGGDSQFCYSTYMGQTPLDREWWGGVLGYCGDGFMHETHVRAWCNKLIQDRENRKSSRDIFIKYCWLDRSTPKFYKPSGGTGSRCLRIRYWQCRTLPCLLGSGYGLHTSIPRQRRLCNLEDRYALTKNYVYFTNKCDALNCGERFCIHRRIHQILVEFESLFVWFLGRIQYWENAGLSEADALDYTGDVVWPTSEHRVGRNSGVMLSMLLQNLVQNSVLPNWQERNMQDACMRYRRFMADQLYSARFTPH